MQSRLVIVDPAHFHASLLQKRMYSWLDRRVAVYAPFGPEIVDYLNRVSLFNSRKDNPTGWELDIHLSDEPMAAMLRDRRGDFVVFTGRNRGKIDRILASLAAGLNVLADKPWIISPEELPKLEEALALADRKRLAAYDIMTERYEITSELQRVLVNDSEIFGTLERGTPDNPGIRARSVHRLMKVVAGVPLRRPAWFFDVAEYGEALADVGTHIVDLVQWSAFPDQPIDYRQDIQVVEGYRWPLQLSKEQFKQVTGESDFTPNLAGYVRAGTLDYYCNNSVYYTIRGVHVKLEILWDWEAPENSGDVYEAVFRGTKSRSEIRQTSKERYVPELYIVPADASQREPVFAAARRKIAALQSKWPGLGVSDSGGELRLTIPEKLRVGHEEHFGQVVNRFSDYLKSPTSLPAWERPNMLAKYYVSTKGVEMARSQPHT